MAIASSSRCDSDVSWEKKLNAFRRSMAEGRARRATEQIDLLVPERLG